MLHSLKFNRVCILFSLFLLIKTVSELFNRLFPFFLNNKNNISILVFINSGSKIFQFDINLKIITFINCNRRKLDV